MSDEQQKLKVVFDPQMLQDLDDMCDGDQQQIQSMIDSITKMFEDGDIIKNSVVVDMDQLQIDDPELYEKLTRVEEDPPTLQ